MSNMHMVGDYTPLEIAEMTVDELEDAQDRDFRKPQQAPVATEPGCQHAECTLTHPHAGPAQLARPAPAPPQDPYAATTWGEAEFDFRTPSGQLCRLKKIRPEDFVGTTLLDRLTVLPGIVQETIDKAEGKPPSVAGLPDREDLDQIISVIVELLPMVVVAPTVHPVPKPDEKRKPGLVYVDMIDLGDQIAILNRVVAGVSKMSSFRKQS